MAELLYATAIGGEPEELSALVSAPLMPAPRRSCILSALAYSFLFLRGTYHFNYVLAQGSFNPVSDSITVDMVVLCVVYILEIAMALGRQRTTLHRWAFCDFGTHHVFFAATVFPAVVVCPSTVRARWPGTLVFVLLVCLNLATTAARAAGAPATLELPCRISLVPLVACLIYMEATESWAAVANPGECAPVLMTVVGVVSLTAPLYHLFIVLPHTFAVIQAKLFGPAEQTRGRRSKQSDMNKLD